MSTLKVPGAQLYYEVEGSGPLLILISGAAGVGEVFRPLARALSARYRVVMYDRRGFLGVTSTDLKIMITGSRPMPMTSGA